MKFSSLLFTLLFCLTLVGRAETLEGVDLKLLSETSSIQAGKPFTVGLHIHHHKDYHSYWKNPGIVGVATSLKWKLPPGFKAAPIQWPVPEIVDMAGHPAHGFHQDVLLMVQITPPADIKSKTITLDTMANWMACARTCHPGFASLTLTLPVGKTAPASPEIAQLFSQARKKLPTPLEGWTTTVLSPPDAPTIRLRLAAESTNAPELKKVYFFSDDGQVSSDQAQLLKMESEGSYLLSMERSEFGPEKATHLSGILTGTTGTSAKLALTGTIKIPFTKIPTRQKP